MKSFKSFIKEQYLLEYLTDEQREKYSKIEMTPKARKNTDHFFGQGNDHVREDIKDQDEENKSEVHKKIEAHLGSSIDVTSYKKGVIKDKYGRDVKIGRLIKDEKLRNQFANDNTRAGVKSSHGHYCTIVRGTEVAGQTNSAPNPEHPKGHSWGEESCKNIDTGIHRTYLKDEIKHGTVVARIHDSSGQEIYRATLQPYHNDAGHVAYHVNGEYGIKHTNFTKHANDVARRLSGEHKGGSIAYTIHPRVYNDFKGEKIIHPNANEEDISLGLKDENALVRQAVVRHPYATKKHIDIGMMDKHPNVRAVAVSHPNATKEQIKTGLKDEDASVRYAAIKHPNATKEHIDRGILDKAPHVRRAAVSHPNATKEHIDIGMMDKDTTVRYAAMWHPNATKEHLDRGMKDSDPGIRQAAVRNPNATKEQIEAGLNDESSDVRQAAVRNPNATKEHIDRGILDKAPHVRRAAVSHPNATKEHIDIGMMDKDHNVRYAAVSHPNATEEQIEAGLNDENAVVRSTARTRLKLNN